MHLSTALTVLLVAYLPHTYAFTTTTPLLRANLLTRKHSKAVCLTQQKSTLAPFRTVQAKSIRMSAVQGSSGVLIDESAIQEIKGVLFDIDGTLFDSDPCHLAVFQDLLAKEGFNGGVKIDEDFFRERIAGRQNAIICADFFPEWDKEKAEAWAYHKEATFREYAARDGLEAMKGLQKFMDWIDTRGLKKAAVTNAPRLNAEFMLKVINKLEWFDEIIIGDECERAKPDPLPYSLAMQRLGLCPENTIVIEDSPSGARAGVASGAFTIGILSSQPKHVLAKEGCKALIQDYEDPVLWKILDAQAVAS